MHRNRAVVRDVLFIRENERAILIETLDGDELWLPKSQIEEDDWDMYDEGDEICVSLPEWLADENAL